MKRQKQKFSHITASILTFSILVTSSIAQASYEGESEDELSFDKIVSELSKSRTKSEPLVTRRKGDPLSQVKIHSGVGFTHSKVQAVSLAGNEIEGLQRGIQATLGIDLFSQYWSAEGAIRSFGETSIEETDVTLREFDLKLVYRDRLGPALKYSLGFGLAARNMTMRENVKSTNTKFTTASQDQSKKFSTPASIIVTGISAELSRTLSLGTEVSYRSAMIDESNDRSAVDMAVRIDAHF